MPNTSTNWEVMIDTPRPEADRSELSETVARAISDNGRVEVEMMRSSGEYIISVYESNHYEYYPEYENGEFIDHALAAHVRPSDNGTGWATTWGEGVELFTNALTSIERDNKWLSDPLTTDKSEFISVDLEVAADQLRALKDDRGNDSRAIITPEEPPTDSELDTLRDVAVEHDFHDLATVCSLRNEYQLETVYMNAFEMVV